MTTRRRVAMTQQSWTALLPPIQLGGLLSTHTHTQRHIHIHIHTHINTDTETTIKFGGPVVASRHRCLGWFVFSGPDGPPRF